MKNALIVCVTVALSVVGCNSSTPPADGGVELQVAAPSGAAPATVVDAGAVEAAASAAAPSASVAAPATSVAK